MTTKKNKKEIAYFIGIGGIGVSALAEYYLAKGWRVSGSDLAGSEVTARLEQHGARVLVGAQQAANVPADIDLVIYSTAVAADNPELVAARELQTSSSRLQVLSYPEALGRLSKQYETIAVCGTHGKSTTCAMLALVMVAAGLDPTVVVGTQLYEFGNANFRAGKSKYLVIEADEYADAFLEYHPKLIVLTNIEAEHLDYFNDFGAVSAAFQKFINKLPADGKLVVNNGDFGARGLVLNQGEYISYKAGLPEMALIKKHLKLPGQHNRSNALAVLIAARALGIADEITLRTLAAYKGAWRRLQKAELRSGGKQFTLISDYAHHPTEVAATLQAIGELYPGRGLWVVFQPHQQDRFNHFFKNFAQTLLKNVNGRVLVTDVYTVQGRDIASNSRTPQQLVELLERQLEVSYMPFVLDALAERILTDARDGEVVVLFGAGDIHELFNRLILAKKH